MQSSTAETLVYKIPCDVKNEINSVAHSCIETLDSCDTLEFSGMTDLEIFETLAIGKSLSFSIFAI